MVCHLLPFAKVGQYCFIGLPTMGFPKARYGWPQGINFLALNL